MVSEIFQKTNYVEIEKDDFLIIQGFCYRIYISVTMQKIKFMYYFERLVYLYVRNIEK